MIRVLVLDDDPEVRYGIYDYLKRDYEIYVTKKENEVFNILNQTNINLIIFDIQGNLYNVGNVGISYEQNGSRSGHKTGFAIFYF